MFFCIHRQVISMLKDLYWPYYCPHCSSFYAISCQNTKSLIPCHTEPTILQYVHYHCQYQYLQPPQTPGQLLNPFQVVAMSWTVISAIVVSCCECRLCFSLFSGRFEQFVHIQPTEQLILSFLQPQQAVVQPVLHFICLVGTTYFKKHASSLIPAQRFLTSSPWSPSMTNCTNTVLGSLISTKTSL